MDLSPYFFLTYCCKAIKSCDPTTCKIYKTNKIQFHKPTVHMVDYFCI